MSTDFRQTLLNYVLKHSRAGDIQSVINAIDKYGWTKQALMNIGDVKGKILDTALQTRRPKTVLELGTFLGYSSLRMASQLPDDVRIITIEINAESAETARRIHEHAGVANRIHIVLGQTNQVIPRLSQQFNIDSFDFIFSVKINLPILSDRWK